MSIHLSIDPSVSLDLIIGLKTLLTSRLIHCVLSPSQSLSTSTLRLFSIQSLNPCFPLSLHQFIDALQIYTHPPIHCMSHGMWCDNKQRARSPNFGAIHSTRTNALGTSITGNQNQWRAIILISLQNIVFHAYLEISIA